MPPVGYHPDQSFQATKRGRFHDAAPSSRSTRGVTPSRRRLVAALTVVVLAVPLVFAARKASTLRRLGTPVHRVTTDAPAPPPLTGTAGWTVKPEGRAGRITDVAVLPARGLVVYVEEVGRR